MLSITKTPPSQLERGWWLLEPASNRKAFGIVLHLIDGSWQVARTLIGSPAERAGLVAGDTLLAVDEYEIGPGRGDPYELSQLMIADRSNEHLLTYMTSSGQVAKTVEKQSLHDLLEIDFDRGGSILGYCVGCRTCRPLTIGATDCSSGCPGNYCTVG